MASANNPRTARVALRVARDTRDFINTFHVARSDDGVLTLADLVNIATVFADWWSNNYRTVVPNIIVGQDVTVTKQDPADPQQTVSFLAAPGSGGTSPLPADVSAAVSWRTGLAGRKFRGRYYVYGFNGGNNNTNDTLIGSYIAALTASAQYLLSHLVTAGLKLIIFHRGDNTKTDVTSVVVDQLIDSMRNRLAGRGI